MSLDNEKRPEEVSKLKDEHIKKQKEGKGHWEEGLASESESAVCCLLPVVFADGTFV